MREEFDEGRGDDDAVWRALCERVYPLRDALGMGDGRRMFHQDLFLLTEMDLELDKLRARFRVCLETDFSDRRWLLERIDTIADEQARRAEFAWPPTDPEEVPVRLTRELEAAPSPPAQEREVARPRSRGASPDVDKSRETLREEVLSMQAQIEREEADRAADRAMETDDAR